MNQPESSPRPSRRGHWGIAIGALLLVLGTAAAIGWYATRGPSAAARVAFEQGLARYRSSHLTDALKSLDEAEILGYPAPDLERLVGLILAAGNEQTKAEPMLVRALNAARSPDPEVCEALARIYLNTYRIREAVPILERWAIDGPSNPTPLIWLAEAEIRENRDPKAILKRFQEAISRDPASLPARLGLAQQWHVLGDEQAAKREYEECLKASGNPNDPQALLGLGRANQALGEEAEAVDHLNKALAIKPDLTEALTRLASVLLRQQQGEEALVLADKAVKLDPFDPETRYTRAMVYAHLGKITEARAEHETTSKLRKDVDRYNVIQLQLSREPDNVGLKAEVARWLLDHGRADEAAEWARIAIAQQANQPEANRVLADYHQSKGEIGLANSYRLRAGK